jgi:nitroimidazol reductase NimA-like FMN-containing flavoprotein (pyridoxamine 5'-phosphate oxidase superfamily)
LTATDPALFATAAENRVCRIAERASYERATVNAILDSSYLCHIGFISSGKPMVIPMTYWRSGEFVYFHSANKGRLAQACIDSDICITVSCFDGLALGHSAFNHSYNYRSVVIHGRAQAIVDPAAKTEAMREFVETIIPGRWAQVRPVKESEIRSIELMRIKLDQASAKIRDAYPDEETVDPDWPVWVGVIPAKLVFGVPLPDPVRNRIPVAPEHIAGFRSMDGFIPSYAAAPADGQAS